MRINSDETLRRAAAFRDANPGRSWLQLTRDAGRQRRSLAYFENGGSSSVFKRR